MKPFALTLVLLSVAALALSACGTSKEDKAKADVCSARADISKQIDSLKSLTLSSSTKTDVTNALGAIKGDLQKIKDAQPDLSSGRKQEVQTATQTFGDQLTQIVKDTIAGLSTKTDAKTQAQTALSSLESAYKQALQPISCS
jgi:K+-sensing histidine kinase KdpD